MPRDGFCLVIQLVGSFSYTPRAVWLFVGLEASSRVTYFIVRAYKGTCVNHSRRRKKLGEVLKKKAGEWTGRVEISKEELPGSKRSMHGYLLIYSRLERENV